MEEDEQSGEEGLEPEDEEVDGHPAKRACIRLSQVFLDSDEDTFARSLPSMHPTPGATSQYKDIEDMETESQDEEAAAQGGTESNQGNADIDEELGNENDEDNQEVGFLDNSICLWSLQ